MEVRYLQIEEDDGQRIDNFVLRELAGVPRSRVYRMLRSGEVRVNGGRIRPRYRLRRGDRVRLPPWHAPALGAAGPAPGWLREQLRDAVLYEDDGLIVVNKPAGIAVHGGGRRGHAQPGLLETLRALRPELERLELAHRLDRDTSGCLLLAKRRATLLSLHAAFRSGAVRKRYDVFVHGQWPRKRRHVTLGLRRYLTPSGERRVRSDVSGKTARTDFELLASGTAGSWLRAQPRTGRTHQIRVHCQRSGHPVLGDVKYANDEQLSSARRAGIGRLCLHACSLVIPEEGGRRRFDAPLPPDMERAWEALR